MNVNTSVRHLFDLEVGDTGRVAYVNCQDDAQLHRFNGLQIKPGVTLTLHQKYPAFVVECEGGMIALDEPIAKNICLWKGTAADPSVPSTNEEAPGKAPGKWRFWRRERA